ncbi:uncharacterized protein PAF06_000863 [Gastrophryne carolinensis]
MKLTIILIFSSLLQLTWSARFSQVKLKNNGYEDIVIAINPHIPENDKLIDSIKKMVTDASPYMLQATENRVYIRSVKILIPSTWKSNSVYGRPKTESYDKADIIIANASISGAEPYTLQYSGCGNPGRYIHLTPIFLLEDALLQEYGPRGRVFVHEWAHLRWGVFDEKNEDIPWYLSKKGNIEATRCPLSLGGLARNEFTKAKCKTDQNGLYEESCKFFPNLDPNVHESIMYGQALEPVHNFCKKDTHNREAPNMQNRLCNEQSTWEVIMKSPDITSSSPLIDTNVPPPTFSLLQYRDRVVTLVLDVSGSMSGYDRINRQYQAAEVYIMQIVEIGSSVGIVTFSSDATIMSSLVKVTDTFKREQLKNLLPKIAGGGTNICAGVRKGFEVNKQLDGITYGTEIVLLTDGEDSGISSCLNEVGASGAVIHTIALGGSADPGLEQLSSTTGGLKLSSSDKVDANGLIDSFSGIKSGNGDVLAQSIQIESTASKIEAGGWMNGTVTIDHTVGKDTFFLVTWNRAAPNMEIIDPKDDIFEHNLFVIDNVLKFARLTIPGTAKQGDWQYKLQNTQSGQQFLSIMVNSRPSDPTVAPIIVDTILIEEGPPPKMTLYATVTQGLTPVLGVNVTAYIEPQNGPITSVPLLDNGAGADIIKDDGIYSKFYIGFNGNGRYGIKVRVENQRKNIKVGTQKSPALYLPGYVENGTLIVNPPKPKITNDNLYLGPFTRTSSGGSFIVSDAPSGLLDVYGPYKITDLEASIEGESVILTWTATGDDLDNGTASAYDLRMSINSDELLDNFENGTRVNISSLIPQPAGSPEYFNFTPEHFPIKNGTVLYFSLVAIDKVNQKSDPSNLARAALFLPPPPSPPISRPYPPPPAKIETKVRTSHVKLLKDTVIQKTKGQDSYSSALPCEENCKTNQVENDRRPFRGAGTNIDAMKISGILFLVSFLQLTWSAKDSQVKLKNNGYEDIVIAINPKIPESEKLINNIKKMVTDASSYMLQATENRVYIRSVKILMPNTWKSNSTYGRPKTESYDKADIIVTDPYIYGDYPYTLQYGGCGEPGKYVHLTPNFLLNDQVLQIFGPRGRVFVHEWAHLRWGVFDEYNDNIPWYRSKEGKVEATRCPLSLGGLAKVQLETSEYVECLMDDATGVYEEGCKFFPNVDPNVHESVMYGQALEPVHEFCKKDTHNREAPNEQNRLCQQQSSWEVIMKSSDIKSSAPLPNSNVPAPTFSLLQYKDRVVTLVLDISGSMGQFNRIDRLYQASEVYIMQIVETGASVGIVVFSSDATITSSLVKITDTFKREQLKKLLPTQATGGTNICAGVRKGFEVNKALDGSTYGTEIVLLTDGEDGGISSCFAEVEASGAVIHTIALGGSADPGLEQLSSKTGGLKLFASDKVDANGLIDSFSGITSGSGDVSAQSIQLESTANAVESQQCLTDKVTIDSTVGNDTFFLVTWSIATPNIKLTDPNGNIFENAQFSVDATSKSARLRVPGTAQQGDWHYNLCNTQPGAQVLGITVNSRPADPSVPPILVETYLSADANSFGTPMVVYATVTQGLAPVLGVKVTAYIETQTGHITPLTLLDNGAGADIIKNDGIYSKFYTDYNGNGRYSVKVRVENQGKDNKGGVPKSRALYLPGYVENGTLVTNPPKPKITIEDLNLGNFTRTSSGGSFVVTNVPSGPLPDIHGPSKINNLEARIENKTVILTWTATGDDLDKGNASMYDLRMSFNSDELLDNFENGTRVNTTSIIPKPAGSLEYFSFTPVNITIKNGTVFYFSLVAIDKVNQRSAPSNLARAAMFLPTPPPPPPPPTSRPYPTTKPGNSATGVTGSMSTIILFLVTITALHSTVVES